MSGTSSSRTVHAPAMTNGYHHQQQKASRNEKCSCFQMPLHYPRFKKSDYEAMPDWKLDCMLKEYGLPVEGHVDQKREFAMGAFLWPSQNE